MVPRLVALCRFAGTEILETVPRSFFLAIAWELSTTNGASVLFPNLISPTAVFSSCIQFVPDDPDDLMHGRPTGLDGLAWM